MGVVGGGRRGADSDGVVAIAVVTVVAAAGLIMGNRRIRMKGIYLYLMKEVK